MPGDRTGETKPQHLYAYTDSNAVSETLYAWDANYASSPTVLYTKDEVPTTSSKYYDENGNEIALSSIVYNGWIATGLRSSNSNELTFECYD